MALRKIRNAFFAGLLVLLPVVTTIYLIHMAFQWVDGLLGGYVERWFGQRIPGLGLMLVLSVVTLTGLLASNYLGKSVVNYFNRLIERVPLIGGVYGTIKQITESLTSKDKTVFRSVVLVEFPRKGIFSAGFVVGEIAPEILGVGNEGEEYAQVFIPTVPNPTTGYLVILPVEEIRPLNLSVEEALKYFVSVGVVKPRPGRGNKGGQQEV